jgi:group I intron endonuclease
MGVIYKIISPSNKVYIGKTYNLNLRVASHKYSANKMNKDIILHNSIRKYGWDAHILQVIEECIDSVLNEREIYWITELNTYCYENENGMNMTKGGEGQRSTWMHKTELRKWVSDKFSGEGNPFYGKKHSEETKAFLSKNASQRNIREGRKIPKWGAEKGRLKIIRPVICYTCSGNFLKEYVSVTEAANDLKIKPNNIVNNCKSRQTQCGNFVFKYKTENYPLKIEVGKINQKAIKRPVLTLTEDYEIVCEHLSAQEASEFWKIPKGTINRAAMYNWLKPIRTGHVFIYTDLYAEILKQTA